MLAGGARLGADPSAVETALVAAGGDCHKALRQLEAAAQQAAAEREAQLSRQSSVASSPNVFGTANSSHLLSPLPTAEAASAWQPQPAAYTAGHAAGPAEAQQEPVPWEQQQLPQPAAVVPAHTTDSAQGWYEQQQVPPACMDRQEPDAAELDDLLGMLGIA